MTIDDFVIHLADFIEANSKDEAVEILSKSLIAIARTDNRHNLGYEDELGRVDISLAESAKRELH